MTKDWRYMELESINHLQNNGRELLGKNIYFTEKRDGSCLAIWLNLLSRKRRILNKILRKRADNIPDPYKWDIIVSSRNQEMAEQSIISDFHLCKDSMPVLVYLNDNPFHIVFGELLRKGLSPTRIENHEEVEFIVFDIFDGEHFFNFQQVNQFCFHYGMKSVRLFGEGRFTSMESLFEYRDQMLELCKQEKREGVVLKTFTTENKPLYCKEKLDTAKSRGQPKIERGRPEYPSLPFSEAIGAVDKVFADMGEEFSIKAKAMPMVAKYIQEEMRKHQCSAPEMDFYKLYCQYCEDRNIEMEVTLKIIKTPSEKKQSIWNKLREAIKNVKDRKT